MDNDEGPWLDRAPSGLSRRRRAGRRAGFWTLRELIESRQEAPADGPAPGVRKAGARPASATPQGARIVERLRRAGRALSMEEIATALGRKTGGSGSSALAPLLLALAQEGVVEVEDGLLFRLKG